MTKRNNRQQAESVGIEGEQAHLALFAIKRYQELLKKIAFKEGRTNEELEAFGLPSLNTLTLEIIMVDKEFNIDALMKEDND